MKVPLNRILATSVALTATLLVSGVPATSPPQYSPMAAEENRRGTELSALLQKDPRQQKEIFSEALRMVKTLESAETCTKLAALTLLNDCKSIEYGTCKTCTSPDDTLESVKSEYAARLAVCELNGAGARVPQECATLIPSKRACAGSGIGSWFSRNEIPENKICYPDSSLAQLQRCLSALGSRPQYWTSYSNARQNAVVMCQASRDGVERDKTLAVHKSLTEIIEHMSSQLLNLVEESQVWLDKQQVQLNVQKAFAEQIRRSQNQALQEMRLNTEKAESFVDRVMTSLLSFKGMIIEANDETHASIHQSQQRMNELRNDLTGFVSAHKDELQLEHERQIANLQLHSEAAAYGVNNVRNFIASLQNEVDISSRNIVQKIGLIDQRIDNLENKSRVIEITLDRSGERIMTFKKATRANIADSKLWLSIIATMGLVVSVFKIRPMLAWRLTSVLCSLGLASLIGERIVCYFQQMNFDWSSPDNIFFPITFLGTILLYSLTYESVRSSIWTLVLYIRASLSF